MTEDEMVRWHHQLMSLSKFQEQVKDKEAWHATVHGVKEAAMTQQLNNKIYSNLINCIINTLSNSKWNAMNAIFSIPPFQETYEHCIKYLIICEKIKLFQLLNPFDFGKEETCMRGQFITSNHLACNLQTALLKAKVRAFGKKLVFHNIHFAPHE